MTPPPLAICQARMGSTRLPDKMVLDLGGKPLCWWAWNAAVQAFGRENVVFAIPSGAANDGLARVCENFGSTVFRWGLHGIDGNGERDVLARFHACAHRYRWEPSTVVVRITCDDPFKRPEALRRVAAGERLPVELGGEAFTLAQLDEAHRRIPFNDAHREHLTHALFPGSPPPPPPEGQVWTVDTVEDLEAARKLVDTMRALEATTAACAMVTRMAMPYLERAFASDVQYGETLSENAGG